MKLISRRSFLGKLAALALVPLLPIKAAAAIFDTPKKKVGFSVRTGSKAFCGDVLSVRKGNAIYPCDGSSYAIGVAARVIKKGERIEYNPNGNTKDILTTNLGLDIESLKTFRLL